MLLQLLAETGFSPSPPTINPASEQIGAVGHLIAAVLETAGFFAQSEVLDTFMGYLTSVGVLLYAFSVAWAVVSVAVYGNYRQAAYLLLGPGLFYFVLTSRVPATATVLKFGNRVTANSAIDQREFLKLIGNMGLDVDDPEVSWIFARIDRLVSAVAQGVVSVFLDTENMQDITHAATERVYSRVLLHQGLEKGYLQLVSLGVMGKCANVNELGNSLAQKDKTGVLAKERSKIQARYDVLRNEKQLLEASTVDYLLTLNPDSETLSSCPNGSTAFDKLPARGVGSESAQFVATCDEIWSYVCIGSMVEARQALEETTNPVDQDSGIPWKKVKERVEYSLTHGGTSADAVRLLAANILKNTLSNTVHGAMTHKLSSRVRFNSVSYDAIYGSNAEADAKGARVSLVFFAGTIPYIQGLLLFMLSLAFPFFAIFLLLPSRWTSFFIWISLWVWVKSWDIGFAVVYVLREYLWKFMQNGVGLNHAVDWTDPESVYKVIYQNDPLATTNTYYQIVALLTISVPFITAQFATGANHLYQVFSRSIENPAKLIGRRVSQQRRLFEIYNPVQNQRDIDSQNYALDQVRAHYGDRYDVDKMIDSLKASDGTVPRDMQSLYNNALFNYRYAGAGGNKWTDLSSRASMTYGRVDDWGFDSSRMLVENYLHDRMKENYGRAAGDLFSTKVQDQRTRVGPGAITPVQPQAGDETGE